MTEIERHDWFSVESPDSKGAILLVLQTRDNSLPTRKKLVFGLYVSKHRVREGEGGRETERERGRDERERERSGEGEKEKFRFG